MVLADLDLGQVVIIVIAVVAGFLQWLWKLIQQGKEEHERRNPPPLDPEEQRQRDEVWRRQVQEAPPRPAPTATPPPLHDPWSTVRDVFETMKEEMRKKQAELDRKSSPPAAPATPPPLPAPAPVPAAPPPQPRRGTVAAELHRPQRPAETRTSHRTQAHASPAPAPLPVAAPISQPVTPLPTAAITATQKQPEMSALRALLHRPASVRQAILIREILGPPKALQSGADAPF